MFFARETCLHFYKLCMLYFYLSFSLEESRLSRFSSLYVSVFSLHISFSLPLFLWKILIKTFREQRAHIVRKRSPNKVFFGRRFLGQFIEVAAAQGNTLWDRQGWWSDENGTQRWFSKLCYVRWTNPTFLAWCVQDARHEFIVKNRLSGHGTLIVLTRLVRR